MTSKEEEEFHKLLLELEHKVNNAIHIKVDKGFKPPETAEEAMELVAAILPEVRRRQAENGVPRSPAWQLEAAAKEGEARGLIKAIFTLMKCRGIKPPDDVLVRIMDCRDLELLEGWVVCLANPEHVKWLEDQLKRRRRSERADQSAGGGVDGAGDFA